MNTTTLRQRLLVAAIAGVVPLLPASVAAAADDASLVDFFEKKVRPVLVTNCYNCHSANTNAKGGLRVDDRLGLIQGGNSGPAVVPGKPEKSLLLQAVKHEGDVTSMPPKKPLSAEEIADLTTWIKDGAAWPKTTVAVTTANTKYDKLRKEHWAWQPLAKAPVPEVKDTAWPRGDVDRFILAGLEAKGLAPVADAERPALLRRVTFDLTGLPPTIEEMDAFLNDQTPDAFGKVVDRLLASPAFGERWGRHWLDVARYGESTGSSRNVPFPQAWRYRDYVIDAFTTDKPYDQFIREQIAGDLLPASSDREKEQQMIATGFLALGVKDVNQRFKVRFTMDNIDEQIDTVTRSVLALTASCARCHDHKFDPIPTLDYYALAGIFHSTDLCAGVRNKMGGGGMDYYDRSMLLQVGEAKPLDAATLEKIEETKKALADAQQAFEAIRGKPEGKQPGPNGQPKQAAARQQVTKLQNELDALSDPAAQGIAAIGVRESKVVGDTEIRLRGEAEKLGSLAPRGFLTLVDVPGAAKVNPKQSGRLELAQWLTSDKNPLTSRVMANRVWHYLFGRGLVSSVDNFGTTGDKPTHPELLDHLAKEFVRDGWSVKQLVRKIVLTRTYQLGVEVPSEYLTVDPANHLVWRHSPRRLEAEEIRDSMLAVAGKLDRTRVQASPTKDLKVMEVRDNGADAQRFSNESQNSLHRSVYLPLVRGWVPRSMEVFDFASQGMVTGARDTTTVAPQALYLLNDPFVKKQATALAERVLQPTGLEDADRLQLAYRLTMGRTATTKEIERAQTYLSEYESAEGRVPTARNAAWASFCHALLGSAEFHYLQ
jgi:cytochrome c553